MSERRRKHVRRGTRRQRRERRPQRTAAPSRPEDTTGAADNILFLTDPPDWKPSFHKPKSWTDTVAGYIREAKRLTTCILRNERLMDHPYQWHVTINFEAEQTPAEIRERWARVRKSLKRSGVVALSVMEVSRSNRVHFHLIVSSKTSKAALDQAVEKAMPSRGVIGWHKRLQRIEDGEMWQLAHYVTKAKVAGYVNGRPVEDYYASKRLLFKPKLGLRKHYPIGGFWMKSRAAIWKEVAAKEARIAEGLDRPGVRRLVDHVYELLGRTEELEDIERAFGYHAESEPVRRWIEQLIAGEDGGYEAARDAEAG